MADNPTPDTPAVADGAPPDPMWVSGESVKIAQWDTGFTGLPQALRAVASLLEADELLTLITAVVLPEGTLQVTFTRDDVYEDGDHRG